MELQGTQTHAPGVVVGGRYELRGVLGRGAMAEVRPFPQEDLGPLAHAILHESPPPLVALRPDVPPGVAATIERTMARDPAWRFDRANAMRAALVGASVGPAPVRPATRVMTAPLPAMTACTPRRRAAGAV
ncbi:hypothetical protein [Mycobacterium sp.]|uniref:hypothetical protein n=1 Tax=Mycobacterium sp. TaxID=1785 RepID=UPI002D7E992E|nr:hypothetical protein [Mycobacterium sp.]